MKKTSNKIIFVIIFLTIIGLCVYFYYNFTSSSIDLPIKKGVTSENTSTTTEDVISSDILPDNTLEYRNTLHDFSLFYPDDLKVKEYDEGGSVQTVVIEDARGEKGFQIFIVPYSSQKITKERFKMDMPSGVMEEPTNIVIDSNIPATMFFGSNAILGKTREVWFVKDGYLYEITALAELDGWLADILVTLHFKL